MHLPVPINQDNLVSGSPSTDHLGTSCWLDLSHVPELVVLVQVGKNLREGLTLPLGHQLREALAGLGGLEFLLH